MATRSAMKQSASEELEIVGELLTHVVPGQDALLPLLHDVQARLGYIPKDAIRAIAQALNLSRADVHGVVSFYHDFHEQPTANHVVQLCMAEACQSVGCRALASHAKQELGIEFNDTTPDGRIQIESAYCFGNCAAGPTIRIDDRIHGRVDTARFDALMASLQSKVGAS